MTDRLRITIAVVGILIWTIWAGLSRAQIPSCEQQLARAQARVSATFDQVKVCQNHEFYKCASTNCSAPDATGLVTCLSEGCEAEPVLVPEPGFGVALGMGSLLLVLLVRR